MSNSVSGDNSKAIIITANTATNITTAADAEKFVERNLDSKDRRKIEHLAHQNNCKTFTEIWTTEAGDAVCTHYRDDLIVPTTTCESVCDLKLQKQQQAAKNKDPNQIEEDAIEKWLQVPPAAENQDDPQEEEEEDYDMDNDVSSDEIVNVLIDQFEWHDFDVPLQQQSPTNDIEDDGAVSHNVILDCAGNELLLPLLNCGVDDDDDDQDDDQETICETDIEMASNDSITENRCDVDKQADRIDRQIETESGSNESGGDNHFQVVFKSLRSRSIYYSALVGESSCGKIEPNDQDDNDNDDDKDDDKDDDDENVDDDGDDNDNVAIDNVDNRKKMSQKNVPKKFPYRCEHCKLLFKYFRLLEEHYRSTHRDRSMTTFRCNICRFHGRDKRSLKSHVFEKHQELLL